MAARIERVTGVFPRLAGMLGRRAGKLSGGERKMLAMARVLMRGPAIFLLDEPTANLAPMIAGALLTEHVRTLAEAGAAVLIVEQAKAVLAISDRAYALGEGQLRMEGSPAELSASAELVEAFLGGHRDPALPSSDASFRPATRLFRLRAYGTRSSSPRSCRPSRARDGAGAGLDCWLRGGEVR